MRWQFPISGGNRLPRRAIDVHAPATLEELPADGPCVCLLYESEEERDELSRRLRAAKLDGLPWQVVDVRPARRFAIELEGVRHSLERLPSAVGTGAVAALAILDSHRALVASLTLPSLALFLALRFTRGARQPKAALAI